jgi:hypothetical protein
MPQDVIDRIPKRPAKRKGRAVWATMSTIAVIFKCYRTLIHERSLPSSGAAATSLDYGHEEHPLPAHSRHCPFTQAAR